MESQPSLNSISEAFYSLMECADGENVHLDLGYVAESWNIPRSTIFKVAHVAAACGILLFVDQDHVCSILNEGSISNCEQYDESYEAQICELVRMKKYLDDCIAQVSDIQNKLLNSNISLETCDIADAVRDEKSKLIIHAIPGSTLEVPDPSSGILVETEDEKVCSRHQVYVHSTQGPIDIYLIENIVNGDTTEANPNKQPLKQRIQWEDVVADARAGTFGSQQDAAGRFGGALGKLASEFLKNNPNAEQIKTEKNNLQAMRAGENHTKSECEIFADRVTLNKEVAPLTMYQIPSKCVKPWRPDSKYYRYLVKEASSQGEQLDQFDIYHDLIRPNYGSTLANQPRFVSYTIDRTGRSYVYDRLTDKSIWYAPSGKGLLVNPNGEEINETLRKLQRAMNRESTFHCKSMAAVAAAHNTGGVARIKPLPGRDFESILLGHELFISENMSSLKTVNPSTAEEMMMNRWNGLTHKERESYVSRAETLRRGTNGGKWPTKKKRKLTANSRTLSIQNTATNSGSMQRNTVTQPPQLPKPEVDSQATTSPIFPQLPSQPIHVDPSKLYLNPPVSVPDSSSNPMAYTGFGVVPADMSSSPYMMQQQMFPNITTQPFGSTIPQNFQLHHPGPLYSMPHAPSFPGMVPPPSFGVAPRAPTPSIPMYGMGAFPQPNNFGGANPYQMPTIGMPQMPGMTYNNLGMMNVVYPTMETSLTDPNVIAKIMYQLSNMPVDSLQFQFLWYQYQSQGIDLRTFVDQAKQILSSYPGVFDWVR